MNGRRNICYIESLFHNCYIMRVLVIILLFQSFNKEGFITRFSGSDTVGLLNINNEDFSVTNFTGPGCVQDGFYCFVHVFIAYDN